MKFDIIKLKLNFYRKKDRNLKYLLAIFMLFTLLNAADFDDIDDFDSEFNQPEIFDPLYGYNNFMTHVNDKIYKYGAIPISKGYAYVVPKPIRGAFNDFFNNLLYPVRFVSSILQGNFENSWYETKRFAINTTMGFLGFADSAALHYDMPKKNPKDIGQTLGYWGIGSGFPITWPVLGQSNLRDSVGLVGDHFLNPITYLDTKWYNKLSISAFRVINEVSMEPDAYINLTKGTLSLYPFLRDVYEQRRNYLINN